ncbi:MAG: FIST N-terminal domain-containing protein [Pseudomonadota bacterium]
MDIVVEAVAGIGTASAMMRLLAPLRAKDRPPDFLAVHTSVAHDIELVRAAAAELGAGALHGGTTCFGVMACGTVQDAGDSGIGCFAIWDPDGDYGSSLAAIGSDAFAAGRSAAAAAMTEAGRTGQAPDIVYVSATPGREEEILAGIESVVGANTPILGGSAADNDLSGGWRLFGDDAIAADAVVVSALYPSRPVSLAYQCGFAPTDRSGIVTRAEGRRIMEIDGQPAGEVYQRWTDGAIAMPSAGAKTVLAESTLYPLGRAAGAVSDIPFYLLVHPAAVSADGGIDIFAEVGLGERLHLMSSSVDALTERAGRVVSLAASRGRLVPGEIAGALMVYCGGRMMTVRDRMHRVAQDMHRAVDAAPSLGIFTFGEQGPDILGRNRHGNLMLSCLTFSK